MTLNDEILQVFCYEAIKEQILKEIDRKKIKKILIKKILDEYMTEEYLENIISGLIDFDDDFEDKIKEILFEQFLKKIKKVEVKIL